MKIYTTCSVCDQLLWVVVGDGKGHHPECTQEGEGYLAALRGAFLAAVERGDDREATNLALTLDRASMAPEDVLTAVLMYTDWDWPVFPLRPLDKTPATTNGFKDASTNPDVMRDWWPACPGNTDYNVGVATGHLFDVVDVDYRTNPAALTAWLDVSEQFEVDGIVDTPNGVHYYVQPTGRGNQAKMNGVNGLDYRGRGGYVVVPPSQRGRVGNRWTRYTWRSAPSPRIKKGWDQAAWERP